MISKSFLTTIVILTSLYAISITIREYQAPLFQLIDQSYSCIISPFSIFSILFSNTMIFRPISYLTLEYINISLPLIEPQLSIFPNEVIKKSLCTNTIPEKIDIFTYKKFDNCKNESDKSNRPLCKIGCQWCERDFYTCSELNFDTSEKTSFFLLD